MDDLEPLSGWATKEQADAAVGRYVSALKKGQRRLLEEVQRAPSDENYVEPGDFTPEERESFLPVIAQKTRSQIERP